VKEEFKSGYKMGIDETDDGTIYITAEFDDRVAMYMFDKDMYCYITIIIPKNEGLIQALIERYNKEYAIISPTKWRYYSNGMYSEITFQNQLDTDVFVWKRGDD